MQSIVHGGNDLLVRACATAAICLFAYAAVALGVLHILRPDYAPATNFVSNYAVGPYGWIMTTFFVAFSIALLALVAGLFMGPVKGAFGLIGLGALLVTAAGLIVTAIYPTDLPGAPYTRSGDIHELSFRINVVGILFGVLGLSAALGAAQTWRRYRRTVWSLACLIVIALAIQFATLRKGLPYGLANRFFVVVVFTWMIYVADRLRRQGRPANVAS
jgi:hypothetical protein